MQNRWAFLRDSVPAEDPDPEEGRLQEEGGQALHGQRSAEDVAHQPRVGGPVHAELELLNESRDHPDRHIDQEQRTEEASKSAISVVAVAVPRRLQQGDQERETDSDRHEKEVVDAGTGELPAGQVRGSRGVPLYVEDRVIGDGPGHYRVSERWGGSWRCSSSRSPTRPDGFQPVDPARLDN